MFKDTKVGTGWNEWVNWDPDTQYALKNAVNILSLVSQITKCQFYILYSCKLSYTVADYVPCSSGRSSQSNMTPCALFQLPVSTFVSLNACFLGSTDYKNVFLGFLACLLYTLSHSSFSTLFCFLL